MYRYIRSSDTVDKTPGYLESLISKHAGSDLESVEVTGSDGQYSAKIRLHICNMQNISTLNFTGINIEYQKRKQWLSDCEEAVLKIVGFISVVVTRIYRYMNQDDFDNADNIGLYMNISREIINSETTSVSVITDNSRRDLNFSSGANQGKIAADIINEIYRVLYN